eukprot:g71483.t1
MLLHMIRYWKCTIHLAGRMMVKKYLKPRKEWLKGNAETMRSTMKESLFVLLSLSCRFSSEPTGKVILAYFVRVVISGPACFGHFSIYSTSFVRPFLFVELLKKNITEINDLGSNFYFLGLFIWTILMGCHCKTRQK